MADFAAIAARFPDMTCRQMAVLLAVAASGGGSTRRYAEAVCLSKPATTRATQALASYGLLASRRDAEDCRRVVLEVTREGRRFLAEVGATGIETMRRAA